MIHCHHQAAVKGFKKNKLLKRAIYIFGIIAIFSCEKQSKSSYPTKIKTQTKKILPSFKSSNWLTIDYGGLINKSIITHSGETIGEIIPKIPDYPDDYKGLVQSYLEPYSLLCHDVLLSSILPDSLPLINILAHYPVGSEQPTWVDLFREGNFQLYYNNYLIRVFIKGTDAENSFNRYQSIIRHPIRDLVNSENNSIDNLEIYVFENNYSTSQIRLNSIPKIVNINNVDLSSKRKSIDLNSINNFLSEGVILEAVEVDANNDLYFYGVRAAKQTMAGYQLSLSDIAVIYRSIFHYGNNAPYISLDKNEDNRYAKVNFGGHLENTRPGSVVLEADKLFKALSTGLDPNTNNLIKAKITKSVSEFLTEDERNLLEKLTNEQTQIRYWFYPDSIGTVTDGSIGAVLNNQFLADVERMDTNLNAGNAVRKTINHLNQNYNQYEKSIKTFQELNTAGRIMALVNWFKGMDMDKRIELDEFLSVNLPAITTPKKTKKMLAITAAAYPSNSYYSGVNNSFLTAQNVRNYVKVFNISELIDKYDAATTDKYFLEVAQDYFSNIDFSILAPSRYNDLKNRKEVIESLISEKEKTLDRYSSSEINAFNKLVKQQNDLYNKLNNMNCCNTQAITSISGGINLRPSEFKRVAVNKSSPKIKKILALKSKIKSSGKIPISINWIRSKQGIGQPMINLLPKENWTSSKSIINNGEIRFVNKSTLGNKSSLVVRELGNWTSSTTINGLKDEITYDKNSNQLSTFHSSYQKKFNGVFSNKSKIIFFALK